MGISYISFLQRGEMFHDNGDSGYDTLHAQSDNFGSINFTKEYYRDIGL